MTHGGSRWPLVAVACLGQFLAVLSTNVVAVALPAIGEGVDARPTGLQWIINAYLLVFATLLIPAGAMGDRHGPKRAMLLGIGVFGLGSVLCGLASSLGVLLIGRVLQGVGPALFQTSSLAILRVTFEDERERAMAIGAWAAVSGLALAVGPAIGGAVSDGLSWRWVFLMNVPFVLVILAVGGPLVPRMRVPRILAPIDWGGLALVSTGLMLLAVALVQGQDAGWAAPGILATVAVSILALAGFVRWERGREAPLVDVSLFRIPAYAAATVASVVVFFSFVGGVVYLSTYFQEVQGLSASAAGLHVLPIGVAFALSSPLSGWLGARFGPRLPIVTGLGVSGCGMLSLVTLGTSTGGAATTSMFSVIGVGVGLALGPINNVAVSVVDAPRAGMASGVLSAMRQFGQLLGVAVLGAIVYGAAPDGGAADPTGYLHGLRLAMAAAAATLLAAGVLAAVIFSRAMVVVGATTTEGRGSTDR